MNDKQLLVLVEKYLKIYPDERANLQLLLFQLQNNDAMNDRKTLPGHITGSALVLSPDKTKLLLIYHKLMDMWLQPGGHWDPDESDPLHAAQREAVEETAVAIAKYLPITASNPLMPLHIDSHPIPARPEKQESPHLHHDFAYVFIAQDESLTHRPTEVADAKWVTFDAPECAGLDKRFEKLLHSGLL